MGRIRELYRCELKCTAYIAAFSINGWPLPIAGGFFRLPVITIVACGFRVVSCTVLR